MEAKQKKAMICLNGQPPAREIIEKQVKHVDLIIAADGGVNWLIDYGIFPDLVIGDLDSAKPENLRKVPSLRIKDQNSTDLEKAFHYAIENGVTSVDLLGVEAGRIDHHLGNFFLLWQFVEDLSIRIIGDDWIGLFLKQENRMRIQKDTIVSLIPFTSCQELTLKGFMYNLDKRNTSLGEIGVSNVTVEEEVRIEMKKGKILGIFYDQNLEWSSM